MPWTAKSAHAKTHKANTPKKQRQWSDVVNALYSKGVPEGQAIREANGVIKKESNRG